MTFTPGMFLKFDPPEWDLRLGELVDISDLTEDERFKRRS